MEKKLQKQRAKKQKELKVKQQKLNLMKGMVISS